MSRYYDDHDYYETYPNAAELLYAATQRAFAGRRGQRLLGRLVATLDAMPEHRLVGDSFQTADGGVCTLGAVGVAASIDMTELERLAKRCDEDPDFLEALFDATARAFDVAPSMAAAIMHRNDGGPFRETPEERWTRMREWAALKLRGVAT